MDSKKVYLEDLECSGIGKLMSAVGTISGSLCLEKKAQDDLDWLEPQYMEVIQKQ